MGNITYTGRITERPEWGQTKNGKPQLKITLAEDHRKKKQNSDEYETVGTTWHNSLVYDGQSGLATALAMDPQVNKGALVEVEARYSERKYVKDGEPRTYFEEIISGFTVKFPPRDEQPAVHPDASGETSSAPADDDDAF